MSELFPAKVIAIQIFRCREEAQTGRMNRWYDKGFIPLARRIPGVAGVYRYIARDYDYGEGMEPLNQYRCQPVRFLTLYRLDGAEPEKTAEKIKKASEETCLDCMEFLEFTLWDFWCMRQSIQKPFRQEPTHLPDGMPEMFMLVPNVIYPENLPEMDDWWLYTHAHDLMEIPGYVQASRYHNITPSAMEGDPVSLNIYEIDSEDPYQHPLRENIAGDVLRAREGRVADLDWKKPRPRETWLFGAFQHWDIMSGF